MGMVLTRLHARYGKDVDQDLVFKAAPPIVGGREHVVGYAGGLEEGAKPGSVNNFQGRYAIRHAWTGPIECENPRRGVWGGPPNGVQPPVAPATDLAFVPRGKAKLASFVKAEVPEIGYKPGEADPAVPDQPQTGAGKVTTDGKATAPEDKKSGCAVASRERGGATAWLLLAFGLLAVRRRRA
jgi:MYXO-CTERM domain-containing protein